MTQIIAVVSHKGGVGKTSLVQNLGYELTRGQRRVLLVDLDPLPT
jgi:chromosome partitioning protein